MLLSVIYSEKCFLMNMHSKDVSREKFQSTQWHQASRTSWEVLLKVRKHLTALKSHSFQCSESSWFHRQLNSHQRVEHCFGKGIYQTQASLGAPHSNFRRIWLPFPAAISSHNAPVHFCRRKQPWMPPHLQYQPAPSKTISKKAAECWDHFLESSLETMHNQSRTFLQL